MKTVEADLRAFGEYIYLEADDYRCVRVQFRLLCQVHYLAR